MAISPIYVNANHTQLGWKYEKLGVIIRGVFDFNTEKCVINYFKYKVHFQGVKVLKDFLTDITCALLTERPDIDITLDEVCKHFEFNRNKFGKCKINYDGVFCNIFIF